MNLRTETVGVLADTPAEKLAPFLVERLLVSAAGDRMLVFGPAETRLLAMYVLHAAWGQKALRLCFYNALIGGVLFGFWGINVYLFGATSSTLLGWLSAISIALYAASNAFGVYLHLRRSWGL